MSNLLPICTTILLLCSTALAQTNASPASDTDWPQATQLSKPWTRWWWMGSGVDQRNLSREIQQMRDVGIGGVEITPLYGVDGYEDRQIDFLSPKWIEMLRFTGEEGKRLDFGVDMATGTGWPFGGGPVVTPDIADTKITLSPEGKLVPVPTEMKVKRAAPGDEGWVLDPYSIEAITKYLAWFEPLNNVPRGLISGQFHDSFEYMGDWTRTLPDRFKQMHGYDINDHAKELFGQGDPDAVARIKSDYRETLSAMHYDYIAYWVKWCHDHGYEARNQAHGAPGNLLDLYGVADVPETETFGSTPFTIPGFRRDASDIASNGNGPNPIVTRFATSAEHVMGRPLASSETLTWLRDHFKIAPWMAKPEVDQMFVSGINHVLYHGTCYSPDDAPWPGWLFYASTEVNPRDTFWKTLPQLNAYITRCQSILQAGKPDNDVLVYFPIFDHWDTAEGMEIFFKVNIAPPWLVGTEIEKTCKQLTEAGFAFDMISDKQLQQAENDGDLLRVPGGSYRVLLIPKTKKMPVETMRKIASLVEGGAKVVFADAPPADVPGFSRVAERQAEMKQLTAKFGVGPVPASGVRQATVGSGMVYSGFATQDALVRAGARRESLAGQRVEFIRRKFDRGYHYFIASMGTRSLEGWTPLEVKAQSVVIMDPLTGRTGVAQVRNDVGGTEVYLQLKPGQSIILRTFTSQNAQGEPWKYSHPAGNPVEMKGTWQVVFLDGGPAQPAPFTTDKLDSWTTLGDAEARRFAGSARYRITFDRPQGITGKCMLDLGDLRESAIVRLNGTEIGSVWSLPFEIELPQLKPTGNSLEIVVTNLTANRIRDLDQRGIKWRIFKEINYVNIDYQPFDASKWPIAPSGLLGPVRLVPME